MIAQYLLPKKKKSEVVDSELRNVTSYLIMTISVTSANVLNIMEKVKSFQEGDWRGIQRNVFFFIHCNLTVCFYSQSNLKIKDVVVKQITAGSMTVSGTFYKNKLPDHKRKLCLCADRVRHRIGGGRRVTAHLVLFLKNYFCKVSWNCKLRKECVGKQTSRFQKDPLQNTT